MDRKDLPAGAVPLQWHRPASVAAARYEIAERALHDIAAQLGDGAGDGNAEEIRLIVDIAQAQLRMAEEMRRRRRPRWLARIVSYSHPREPGGDAVAEPLCFTVEITEGSRRALGRRVEVQVPVTVAEAFGRQVEGMAKAMQRQAARAVLNRGEAGNRMKEKR